MLAMSLSALESTIVAATLHKLHEDVLVIILHTIVTSIQQICRRAVSIALLAVVLWCLLPEIKIRASPHPFADEIPISNTEPQP
jgi:hypothetical protein